VKGTNNYGIPSDHTASLAFTIKPPLLLRKGFIALYVLLIIVIIYYALRFYSTRVRLKNELKIIKMEKVHAEEIERTKEEFFTNISHELRTPISLILPPIHEIQKRGRLDNFSRDLITLAEKNAVRLLRLVNQVLDFNKLGVEVLRLKVSEVEMVSFCKDIFSLFEDQAKRNQIDFLLENKVVEQTVWVDAEKLETVLFNLLSNAFKFTPNGGRIEVLLSLDENPSELNEGVFQIVVKDSGVGIPKEDQRKIFERFYQTPIGKKKESGSGIGLTLVAEYIELHHGFIQLESEIGKGTEFTISIPLGKSHLPVDSIEKDTQIKLLAKPSLKKEKNGSRFYQLKLESDKPTVLLIDDNMDMIDFIRTSLGHKYNFILAQNGQEGLRKANNFNPNIIVSDIMMPKMDGLSLCRKVKENPKTAHISIIFISAKSMTENRVEGISVGADAYIVKPFEIELLEAQIDTLIQRQKELREYFRNELIHLQSPTDSTNNEDNKFVKRVMDLIEANISNSELTVELIASEMAISSTHLYRRLKSITDHSPKEIIQKYRLKKASQLLQNKEGNITEVMYRVGFTSSSYFSKCFKLEYKVSPKQYQEKIRWALYFTRFRWVFYRSLVSTRAGGGSGIFRSPIDRTDSTARNGTRSAMTGLKTGYRVVPIISATGLRSWYRMEIPALKRRITVNPPYGRCMSRCKIQYTPLKKTGFTTKTAVSASTVQRKERQWDEGTADLKRYSEKCRPRSCPNWSSTISTITTIDWWRDRPGTFRKRRSLPSTPFPKWKRCPRMNASPPVNVP